MLLNESVFQALQNESLIHLDVSSGQVSYYNTQPFRHENKKRTKRNTEGKESQKRRCVEVSAPKVVIDLDPPAQEEVSDKPSNEIEVILETTLSESDELPTTGSVWFLELENLLQKSEPSPSPSPVKRKNAKNPKRRKNTKRQLFGESELFPATTSISSSPPLSPSSSAPVLLSPSSPTRLDSIPSLSAFSKFDDDLKRNSMPFALPSLPPLGNLYSSLATLNMLSTPSAFAAPSSLYPLLSPFGLPSYPFVSPFYYGPSSLLYLNNFQASQ